jgi:hypothetical protein
MGSGGQEVGVVSAPKDPVMDVRGSGAEEGKVD